MYVSEPARPPLPKRAEDWILSDAFEHWLATFDNANTRKTHYSSVHFFVDKYAHYRVTDLVRLHVQVYTDDLRSRDVKASHRGRPRRDRKLSPFTVAKDLKAISNFLRWMHHMFPDEIPDLGDFIRIPHLPDRLHREDDIISDEEFQAMLRVADTPLKRVVLHLLWSSGARVGELTTMTLEKTNLTTRTAVVIKKGQRMEREIYFSPDCAVAIYEWLRVRPETDHDYLLCNAKQPFNRFNRPASISQIVRRLAEKAELGRPIRGHRFRKTLTRRIVRKFDIATAALVLGDTVTVTAKYYIIGLQEEARNAVKEVSRTTSSKSEEESNIIPFRRVN